MAFDLSDSFNRMTNQGKYASSRHKGSFMDNINPFGKSLGENVASKINPFGEHTERTGNFLNEGRFFEGLQSTGADNPIGKMFEHWAIKKGKSKKQAMEEGAGGTAAVIAAILTAGASTGASAGAGGASSGGATAGAGSVGGTTATVAPTATTTGATASGGGIGEALGFSGEGGGFMKGMDNVSSLRNMLGGGGGGGGNVNMSQPSQQQFSTPDITDERKGVKKEIKKDSDLPEFGKPKDASLKKKKETIKRRR